MTDETNFDTFEMQDALIVTARGFLQIPELMRIRAQILKVVKPDRARVVLSLQGIDAIEPFGAGVLIAIKQQVEQLGGDLKIACVEPFLLRSLRLGGLTEIFETYRTIEDAVESFDEDMDAPMENAQ